jgi:hypothetical protein
MLCSCSPDRGQTNAARQPQAHNVHAHARAHKKAEDRSIHLPRAFYMCLSHAKKSGPCIFIWCSFYFVHLIFYRDKRVFLRACQKGVNKN